MHIRQLLFTSALTLLFVASVATADDAPTPILSNPYTNAKWGPEVQVEGDIGIGHNARDIGLPQVQIPLWEDDASMLFTNLRYRFDNQQSEEYNLGLGFRKEITPSWILGGYGFFDKLDSQDGYLYSQGTFGVEALSVNNDARINVYVPQSTTHGAPGGGAVEVIGDQIGIAGGAERALPGQDFELGQRLPFDFADVRIYGGAYRYTADNFGMESGPRGRLELTLNDHYLPAIPFGAEVSLGGEIEHDQVRGTEQFALLKVKIPLGGTIHHTTDTLDERMNTFIVRDIDIIEKTGNGGGGGLQPVELNGTTIGSVATVQAGTTLDSVVSAAPTNSLILVNGAGGAISTAGTINMKSGQTLLGSGGSLALTAANTGQTLNYTYAGTTPTVNGNSNTLNTANNTVINNINFSGLNSLQNSASNVLLSHVGINSPVNDGVDIYAGSSNITLSYLTVTNPGFLGVVLENNGQNVTIDHATISGSSYAVVVGNNTITNLSVTNSQLSTTGTYDFSIVNGTVNNLVVANTQLLESATGYGFEALSATLNGVSYNNNQSNNGHYGVEFLNTSVTGLSGSGNTSTGNSSYNCEISGSTISGSFTYNGTSTCP